MKRLCALYCNYNYFLIPFLISYQLQNFDKISWNESKVPTYAGVSYGYTYEENLEFCVMIIRVKRYIYIYIYHIYIYHKRIGNQV